MSIKIVYPDHQRYAKFSENGAFAGCVIGGVNSPEQITDFIAQGAVAITPEEHDLYCQAQTIITGPDGMWTARQTYVRGTNGRPQLMVTTATDEDRYAFYQSQKISDLTQYLGDTDYKQMQWMDGRCTDDEYAPIKALRQEWNQKIRILKECKTLADVQSVTYEKYVKTA